LLVLDPRSASGSEALLLVHIFAPADLRFEAAREHVSSEPRSWSFRRQRTPIVTSLTIHDSLPELDTSSVRPMNDLLEFVHRYQSSSEPPEALHWQGHDEGFASWSRWLQQEFRTSLLPHLDEVLALARQQQVREIVRLDVAFGQVLPKHLKELSLQRGQLLLENTPSRGDRMFSKLKQTIEAGLTPGHYATVFACRAAVFSLSPRLAFLCFCWQELNQISTDGQRYQRFVSAADEIIHHFLFASDQAGLAQVDDNA
jgi:hypothetical protein